MRKEIHNDGEILSLPNNLQSWNFWTNLLTIKTSCTDRVIEMTDQEPFMDLLGLPLAHQWNQNHLHSILHHLICLPGLRLYLPVWHTSHGTLVGKAIEETG